MKAVRFDEYGGVDVLTVTEVPRPVPGPGQVLVEVKAASVNPGEAKIREGFLHSRWPATFPSGQGNDLAGIVAQLGEGVTSVAAGDEVIGWVDNRSSQAEYAVVEAANLTRKPDEVPWPVAGALPVAGFTAWAAVHAVAARAGDTVVVSGAAGGVGQVAGQIGRIEACRVVGIAGGAAKCRFLTQELGFDAAIDYKAEPDLSAAIARACPSGVDVFYDNVGGPTLDAALANLRLGARVVICGRISQTASEALYGVRNLGLLIGKRARIQGFVVFDYHDRYAEARHWLAVQQKAGRIQQRLHVIDDLGRAPDGLGMLFRGENTGKLVVQVAS